MTHTAEERTLTPAMKIALGVVGVLVVGGIVTAMVWNGSGSPDAAAPVASTSPPAPTTPGPLPDATPTTGSEVPSTGSEVPPATARGTGLPPLDAVVPLVKAPLPAPASRSGGIVSGFPTRIADAMDGSTVVSTSIATENTVMQVSLVASSTDDPDSIRAHYLKLWTGLGLVEAPDNGEMLAVTGSFESLTLSVKTTGTGNLYTIFGVFKTE
ncbi:hypothetical protein [Microbacterium sp. KHB019]|uniref:hypothetical protein n=1 Tax=Microbacterium sp. KHB019 TaxID=3129770 RepID=UPI00307A81EA